MTDPSVAIVILNYNGKNYLQKFLPSVLSSSYSNKQIIVADNKSTDDSVGFLQNNFPQIELILLEKNYGFAAGYNQSLKKIKTDYYVLLNSDVEVTEEWIEPVIELMKTDETIAACQPKILSYKNKEYFEYAGAAGGWIDYLGYPFARGRIFNETEKDIHQYDDRQHIFWASGAAMFVRSEIFHSLNGFDEFFFAHQEEIDLCWRMQLASYKIMYCGDSLVYHVGGGTLPEGHKKTFYNFRNNLVMLAKNLSFNEVIWKFPIRIFLDVLFALKSLSGGSSTTFTAIFQAHWAVIKWLFVKEKKQGLNKKQMSKLPGVYNKSLIWAFFVKKKKCFSEIINKKAL